MVIHALGTCPTCSAQAGRGREIPSVLHRLHDALVQLPVRLPQKSILTLIINILSSDEIAKSDFTMYHEYYLSSLMELLEYVPAHGFNIEDLTVKIKAIDLALNMTEGWYLKETVDMMDKEGKRTAELMRRVCVKGMKNMLVEAEEAEAKEKEEGATDDGQSFLVKMKVNKVMKQEAKESKDAATAGDAHA
jgi:hypothetical protein